MTVQDIYFGKSFLHKDSFQVTYSSIGCNQTPFNKVLQWAIFIVAALSDMSWNGSILTNLVSRSWTLWADSADDVHATSLPVFVSPSLLLGLASSVNSHQSTESDVAL